MVAGVISRHDDVAEVPRQILIVRLQCVGFPAVFGAKHDLEALIGSRQLDPGVRQVATDEGRPDVLGADGVQERGYVDVVQLSLTYRKRGIKDVPGDTAWLTAPADGRAIGSHDCQ